MDKKWWETTVVYQVYPRSFCDSNGDGVGDIDGIISKLDYLKSLGIGAIWLNPIYQSPNDDMGYDISDYDKINSEFGDMATFKKLIFELHSRGMKLIMDLVVNHSSDEHRWFVESKKTKDNEYRDYYIWQDGKNGKAPNNWASFFTPSAWKYDENTNQWYLHLFSEKQPDLNWKNPKLREEIYSMINGYFDIGVDGFRMDVINLIAKAVGYPDGGLENKNFQNNVLAHEWFANQPKLHTYLKELRTRCFDGRNCMCVGETPFMTLEIANQLTCENNKELDMLFQFESNDVDAGEGEKWNRKEFDLVVFKGIMAKWQKGLKNNSLFWSNHDQPRPISRFVKVTTENERILASKMLGMAMHFLKGTSYIYQGEEIGMTNVSFKDESQLRDIESLTALEEAKKNGNYDKTWDGVLKVGRDNARTPMQWTSGKNAGFSNGKPWIELNENYTKINVEQALNDENSILNFYKKLIYIKNTNETIIAGEFQELLPKDSNIFAYQRVGNNSTVTVLCNFANEKVEFELHNNKQFKSNNENEFELHNENFGDIILSNTKTTVKTKNFLEPFECVAFELKHKK